MFHKRQLQLLERQLLLKEGRNITVQANPMEGFNRPVMQSLLSQLTTKEHLIILLRRTGETKMLLELKKKLDA